MQKFGLKQVISQKITVQQIQFMGLLQTSGRGLEDKVVKELSENPALEEEITTDIATTTKEGAINTEALAPFSSYETARKRTFSTEDLQHYQKATEMSMLEVLHEQLHLLSLDKEEEKIAMHLVGSLENDGYLRKQLVVLVEELAIYHEVETTILQVEKILKQLQALEPAGIGARDLQECLLLQLKRKKSSPIIQKAIEVLTESFEAFSKKRYEKISAKHDISHIEIKEVTKLVLQLKPKPISTMASQGGREDLVPDFIVSRKDGKLTVALAKQKNFRLGIRKQYTELLAHHQGATTKEAKKVVAFIQQNIQRAKWFIQAIQQRNQTLLRIMEAIMELQSSFFEEGDEYLLRPIFLRDVATKIGMDVSTISRAIRHKAVQTDWNIYPLKYFFSEPIQTTTGREVSSRIVKKRLVELIKKENKQTPYTDEKLTAFLQAEGYLLARRTVAKYRKQLAIPVGRLRKKTLT